jgi:dihydrofolate reductase
MKTEFIALAAVTYDGKLARTSKHVSFGWTSEEDEKFFKAYVDGCDAIIVGRNTYEMSKAIIKKRQRDCIVFTHSVKDIEVRNDLLSYMNPTKKGIVKLCKKRGYKKVAVLGGASVFDFFIKNSLLDTFYLTMEPVFFGAGVPLLSESTRKKIKVERLKRLNTKGTILATIRFE